MRARPDLRIRMAIHRYRTDELSLAKAAQLAGVSWSQMKDILMEQGIQPRLGVETVEEAELEIETFRQYFDDEAERRAQIYEEVKDHPLAGLIGLFSDADDSAHVEDASMNVHKYIAEYYAEQHARLSAGGISREATDYSNLYI